MPNGAKSGVEPALLEAIQHARVHRKSDIALSLAFALERHRLGRTQPAGLEAEDAVLRRGPVRPRPPANGHAHRE